MYRLKNKKEVSNNFPKVLIRNDENFWIIPIPVPCNESSRQVDNYIVCINNCIKCLYRNYIISPDALHNDGRLTFLQWGWYKQLITCHCHPQIHWLVFTIHVNVTCNEYSLYKIIEIKINFYRKNAI